MILQVFVPFILTGGNQLLLLDQFMLVQRTVFCRKMT